MRATFQRTISHQSQERKGSDSSIHSMSSFIPKRKFTVTCNKTVIIVALILSLLLVNKILLLSKSQINNVVTIEAEKTYSTMRKAQSDHSNGKEEGFNRDSQIPSRAAKIFPTLKKKTIRRMPDIRYNFDKKEEKQRNPIEILPQTPNIENHVEKKMEQNWEKNQNDKQVAFDNKENLNHENKGSIDEDQKTLNKIPGVRNVNSIDEEKVLKTTQNQGSAENRKVHFAKSNESLITESDKSGHPSLPFYTPSFNKTLHGKKFKLDPSLETLVSPPEDFLEVKEENWLDKLAFVIAADKDTFNSTLDTIGSIHQNIDIKTKVIYFYDLGLTPDQEQQVQDYCLTYRKFNFDLYPPHVRNLQSQAWKSLILHEVFKESSGVLFIGHNTRILHAFFRQLFESVQTSKGALIFVQEANSIFSVTPPQMLNYLPTKIDKAKSSKLWNNDIQLFYKTKDFYKNVLHWLVLCSLEQNCIEPDSTILCRDQEISCHKPYLAALNILLNNNNDYDEDYFSTTLDYTHFKVTEKQRGPREYAIKSCKSFF